MRKLLLLLLMSLLLLTSCEKDANLWKEYQEIRFGKMDYEEIISKKVLIQFNDEAVKKQSFVTLQLQNENGQAMPGVELVVNGQESTNGQLKVLAKNFSTDNPATVGIKFTDYGLVPSFNSLFKLSGSKRYDGQIAIKSTAAALDFINDNKITNVNPIAWSARLKVPLWKKILFATTCIILASLLLWFLFLRPLMHPHFSGGTIHFEWPQQRKIRLRGRKRIYLGGEKIIKQSFLSRLFTGKFEQYLKDETDFLIEIQPRRKRFSTTARLKTRSAIQMTPYTRGIMKDYELFTIKRPKKDIKFRYQKGK